MLIDPSGNTTNKRATVVTLPHRAHTLCAGAELRFHPLFILSPAAERTYAAAGAIDFSVAQEYNRAHMSTHDIVLTAPAVNQLLRREVAQDPADTRLPPTAGELLHNSTLRPFGVSARDDDIKDALTRGKDMGVLGMAFKGQNHCIDMFPHALHVGFVLKRVPLRTIALHAGPTQRGSPHGAGVPTTHVEPGCTEMPFQLLPWGGVGVPSENELKYEITVAGEVVVQSGAYIYIGERMFFNRNGNHRPGALSHAFRADAGPIPVDEFVLSGCPPIFGI